MNYLSMRNVARLLVLTFGMCSMLNAQTTNAWHGKKCAVVITYDDAIEQQLDHALPLLDSLQLKATFYITAFSPSMQQRLADWKNVARNGHELGNHTLFHPCLGNQPGREWVSAETNMSSYTVQRIENELRMTNIFLQALDGKTKRTFAYTCGDSKVADSFFMNGMRKDFVAARGVLSQMQTMDKIDLYNVDCYVVNNHTAADMQAWVEQARHSNALLVILFHGVGGGNNLDVAVEEHRKFLQWLKKQEQDIWIAPMVEVASYVEQVRK